MAKHRAEDVPGKDSTSERMGGPKHDTGRSARHSKENAEAITEIIEIAGSDLPHRDGHTDK